MVAFKDLPLPLVRESLQPAKSAPLPRCLGLHSPNPTLAQSTRIARLLVVEAAPLLGPVEDQLRGKGHAPDVPSRDAQQAGLRRSGSHGPRTRGGE